MWLAICMCDDVFVKAMITGPADLSADLSTRRQPIVVCGAVILSRDRHAAKQKSRNSNRRGRHAVGHQDDLVAENVTRHFSLTDASLQFCRRVISVWRRGRAFQCLRSAATEQILRHLNVRKGNVNLLAKSHASRYLLRAPSTTRIREATSIPGSRRRRLTPHAADRAAGGTV